MRAADHTKQAEQSTDWVEQVRERVRGLRFGVVEIVVHDGRVVQLETTEKIRLEPVEN